MTFGLWLLIHQQFAGSRFCRGGEFSMCKNIWSANHKKIEEKGKHRGSFPRWGSFYPSQGPLPLMGGGSLTMGPCRSLGTRSIQSFFTLLSSWSSADHQNFITQFWEERLKRGPTRVSLENIRSSERNQAQKATNDMVCLDNISRIGKSIETGSGFMVT